MLGKGGLEEAGLHICGTFLFSEFYFSEFRSLRKVVFAHSQSAVRAIMPSGPQEGGEGGRFSTTDSFLTTTTFCSTSLLLTLDLTLMSTSHSG